MIKYIGRSFYELLYTVDELKEYKNNTISPTDLANIIIILETVKPFEGYELWSATPNCFIFKLKE